MKCTDKEQETCEVEKRGCKGCAYYEDVTDINVGSIEEDIEILERFKNDEMQRDKLERDNRCGGWKIGDIYKLLELNTAIEHLLSDYTRQKQINEEHRKINRRIKRKSKRTRYKK